MKHTPKIFTAIILALNAVSVCAVAKDFKIPEKEIPQNITGRGNCQSIAEEAFYCAVRERTEGKKPNVCSGSEIHRKFPSYTKLVIDELEKRNIPNNDLENSWNLRDELLPKVEQDCKDYLEELIQAVRSSQTQNTEKADSNSQAQSESNQETETLPVYQTQSETRATETTPVSVDKTPTKTTAPAYINVSGKVIDTSGTPLPGITIQVAYQNGELANNSTITDKNGLFSLNRVPSDTGLLVGGSTYEQKWVPTAANMNIRLEGYSADEVFVSCPSNAEWSNAEKHCVCKDTSKQYINGVCVDKPQRTSSLDDAPQELPEETQTIPQYECEQLKTGTKWENGKCICINLEQELTDDGCVDKKTKKEKCNIPNALTTRRDGDVCKVVSCKPGYQKGNNNTACLKKDKTGKECGVRHGTGEFDENGKCILKKCNDDSYKLNEDKNTCEKVNQRELNKRECDRDTSKEWKRGKCVNKCDDTAKWDDGKGECVCEEPDEYMKNGKCVEIDDDTDDAENSTDTNRYNNSQTSENEADPEKLAKLRQAYDDARETEQSHENRLLTTGATVATGIGGMELAKGLSEQNADKTAEQSMASYIATMRCKYGNGKQIKVGLEEVELPGGNDEQMMQLRAEYIALANDLKTRKETLGMKPGIESEKILDKSQIGLYDDENIGITDGAYASLYRAQMYGTQKDQEQIDQTTESSKNRVIGGAVAGGVGAVGGTLGDSLINGKLNELIQSNKDK